MELRWTHGSLSSACHVAAAVRRGLSLVDSRLQEQIAAAAKELDREVTAINAPQDLAWSYLLAHAHQLDSPRELARLVLRKTVGPSTAEGPQAARLAGSLKDLIAALQAVVPDLSGELEHRSRPIREHWEARGPGLLRATASLTEERLFVERAEVVLVPPVLGGDGTALLLTNAVHLEAVLTNVIDGLPEVVRLGWLLAQLQHDVPSVGERVRRDRLDMLSRMAMLPPILEAAETVELSSFSQPTLTRALDAWRIDLPLMTLEDCSEVLLTWWATYLDAKPDWSIALAALERMLFDDAQGT